MTGADVKADLRSWYGPLWMGLQVAKKEGLGRTWSFFVFFVFFFFFFFFWGLALEVGVDHRVWIDLRDWGRPDKAGAARISWDFADRKRMGATPTY